MPRIFATQPQALRAASVAGLCFVAGLIATGSVLSSVALGMTGGVFAWYFFALGRTVAIVETVAVIAALQWLLGPVLAYHLGWGDQKYHMYVGEQAYFGFVLPAYTLLILGLLVSAPFVDLERLRAFVTARRGMDRRFAFVLIALGGAATFVGDASGSAFGFLLYLIAQLKFVGAIYLIIYRWRWRWLAAAAVFLAELTISAEVGMFHNLLLWGALVLSFLCQDLQLKPSAKIGLVAAALLVISALQNTKSDYRTLLREDPNQAGVATLVDLATKDALSGIDVAAVNSRVNEGWIISAVMQHIPSYLPFQQGVSIVQAVEDSLVPRALLDKPDVIQSAKFRLYTGLPVAGGTSFGISVLGEAWANFGMFGALFMGVVGLVYGGALRGLVYFSRREPTLVLWAPLLFLQAIKAETELAIVLNHLAKSFVLILALYFGLKPIISSVMRRSTAGRAGRPLLRSTGGL